MENRLIDRIGMFFYIVGGGALLIFFVSFAAGSTEALLFLFGIGMILFGRTLRRKEGPPPPSARFGAMRSIQSKRDKRRQEKEEREKAKKRQSLS
ncbi:MAG: hypothetical protein FJZ96_06385 [Chloroflexi bacterium]|nr:hypothetical protein [Chloroflexota bacterium]